MKARVHVFISGRVQGVFFRSVLKHNADRYNVKGWVRNLPDGRVEAIFEGEKEALQKLIEISKQGPRGAHVSKLDLKWENYTGDFSRFKINYI